ncbi:MAG TPA: head GIN domain-containing protein [Agriterribacter sp.]|nr:head GIN domain-containing protein [Agriterribacter sp.]
MKKIISPLLVISLLISLGCGDNIQGNGNKTAESRQVGKFHSVRLTGPMNVQLIQGADNALEIEAEENIIPYIETNVDEGKLTIKYKDGVHINNREDITVRVTLPQLQEADITGSGDITSETKLTGRDEIELAITGSGNMNLELDAPSVEAKITGSGDIFLSGQTRDIECTSTGSGKIDATALKAENAVVKTLGSGEVHVFASIKLDATVNGSGDITYKGGASVNSKIHGSGTVKAMD